VESNLSNIVRKKHRIDKVKMIRIMTLEDYQEIEDEKRADLNEGIIDGYLSSVGRQKLLLSANEINQKIGVEKFTHNDMNKKICTLENSRIFLQNKQQLPNCYVFCCSEFTRNKKLEKKFGGAYYEINHIENFKNLLCSELEKKLKLNKLIKEDIHLKAIFQKVQYMSKKTIDFDNLQSNSKGYFLKNTFWKDEKEYRIIFVALDHKKNIISINKGHIDINNNDKLKNYCYVKQN